MLKSGQRVSGKALRYEGCRHKRHAFRVNTAQLVPSIQVEASYGSYLARQAKRTMLYAQHRSSSLARAWRRTWKNGQSIARGSMHVAV